MPAATPKCGPYKSLKLSKPDDSGKSVIKTANFRKSSARSETPPPSQQAPTVADKSLASEGLTNACVEGQSEEYSLSPGGETMGHVMSDSDDQVSETGDKPDGSLERALFEEVPQEHSDASKLEETSTKGTLPIIGPSVQPTWDIPDDVMSWFKTVADLELSVIFGHHRVQSCLCVLRFYSTVG